MTYDIIDSTKLSDDEINKYETNALYTYSSYPYLSDGGDINFECIYKLQLILPSKEVSKNRMVMLIS